MRPWIRFWCAPNNAPRRRVSTHKPGTIIFVGEIFCEDFKQAIIAHVAAPDIIVKVRWWYAVGEKALRAIVQ